jgi:hypothetical protein
MVNWLDSADRHSARAAPAEDSKIAQSGKSQRDISEFPPGKPSQWSSFPNCA